MVLGGQWLQSDTLRWVWFRSFELSLLKGFRIAAEINMIPNWAPSNWTSNNLCLPSLRFNSWWLRFKFYDEAPPERSASCPRTWQWWDNGHHCDVLRYLCWSCMMLYVTWCNMYFNFMRCAGAHCDVMIYSCNQLLHWKCTAAHFFQLPVLHCDCILYTHVNSTSHRLILPDRASLNLLTLKPQGAVFLSMVFPFTYQVGVIKNPLKHPSDPQLPAPKIHPES